MAELDLSYAQLIRRHMESGENRERRELSIREVAVATGYSYEHVRRVLSGEVLVSREFNEALARVLDLDERRLWQLALREKAAKAAGRFSPRMVPPQEGRFLEVWERLSADDRRRVFEFAEALAMTATPGDKAAPGTRSRQQ